jgi:hypothetical protein
VTGSVATTIVAPIIVDLPSIHPFGGLRLAGNYGPRAAAESKRLVLGATGH